MRFWRAIPTLIFVAISLVGCGGRAEVPVATIPDAPSDFSIRQTEIAQQGAATFTAEPTATRTATPAPSPTMTALPTVTPGGATGEPVSTAEGTPDSVVGVRATETPAATAEGGATIAVITGCGPDEITLPVTSAELEASLVAWQQMGEATEAIFSAWEEFFALVEDLMLYEQLVGNTAVFDGAAAFEDAAGEQLPLLEEIEDDSPFYELAQTIIGTTEDQITFAQLLTRAGTQQDPAAWDEALELSATFPQQAEDIDDAHDAACEYWEAQQ